jgi:hypothetical protein
MMNMAHCRFENTLAALEECDEALGNDLQVFEELRESEKKAALKLFELCSGIAATWWEAKK